MSSLLIKESPLQVLPSLACVAGLNEAIVLQQIHYWLNMSQHFYDGRRWVYNSLSGWAEQFPFWSESTLKRAIANLEKQKLVISGNYNRDPRDRTKWYTINYALLNEIESKQKRMTNASGQNDPMENVKLAQCTLGQNDPMRQVKMTQPLPIDYLQENTTEITTENNICVTASPPASGKTAPTSKAEKTPLKEACRKTWEAYQNGYWARYGVDPVRNAKVNGQIKQFVERVGMEVAPHVAEFYLSVNNTFYVQKLHPVGCLLADAESLHTQWATGRTMTAAKAKQIDSTQTNLNAADETIRMLRARRAANGGQHAE
ncbi:TPA: hypothetical protein ACX4EX_003215 [Yersinia enterocolitica]|uniref:hypothetical protein n=1 Tax=Yersinia enterocolitica TaxID=630 RepID=UPI0005FCF1CC|nr:hypothetical protein [Yersinia enterocolitica]EKN5934726.1 hypothetical protein [Yersinia enterocolitica]CRE96427.1 Uncharacterised protein [Yersinia enterocolitica]HDL7351069.1 hypothetical protein [Yersinia enterocolitica]HEN3373666.1 hypothetical protein [Yersinia enterocolitica]